MDYPKLLHDISRYAPPLLTFAFILLLTGCSGSIRPLIAGVYSVVFYFAVIALLFTLSPSMGMGGVYIMIGIGVLALFVFFYIVVPKPPKPPKPPEKKTLQPPGATRIAFIGISSVICLMFALAVHMMAFLAVLGCLVAALYYSVPKKNTFQLPEFQLPWFLRIACIGISIVACLLVGLAKRWDY